MTEPRTFVSESYRDVAGEALLEVVYGSDLDVEMGATGPDVPVISLVLFNASKPIATPMKVSTLNTPTADVLRDYPALAEGINAGFLNSNLGPARVALTEEQAVELAASLLIAAGADPRYMDDFDTPDASLFCDHGIVPAMAG